MAEYRDEEAVGILRIDRDRRNLLTVAQTEMRPRRTGVGRLVDAVADRQIRTLQSLAAAGIDDVWIARRHRERADRSGRLRVEDRRPRSPGVVALPHAAVDDADVKEVRMARDAGDRRRAAAAQRSDETPMQVAIECRRDAGTREHSSGERERSRGMRSRHARVTRSTKAAISEKASRDSGSPAKMCQTCGTPSQRRSVESTPAARALASSRTASSQQPFDRAGLNHQRRQSVQVGIETGCERIVERRVADVGVRDASFAARRRYERRRKIHPRRDEHGAGRRRFVRVAQREQRRERQAAARRIAGDDDRLCAGCRPRAASDIRRPRRAAPPESGVLVRGGSRARKRALHSGGRRRR